jgi:hypothetical protein
LKNKSSLIGLNIVVEQGWTLHWRTVARMYTISVMQQNASMDEKRQHTLQNSELSFSTFKYNAVAVVRLLKKAKGEKY